MYVVCALLPSSPATPTLPAFDRAVFTGAGDSMAIGTINVHYSHVASGALHDQLLNLRLLGPGYGSAELSVRARFKESVYMLI